MASEWTERWDGPSLEIAEARRVAVFRALHLGDFLCAVPALRALKGRFPEAEFTLIGLPWTRSILDRYPYVDRFLEFPGYMGLEGISWEPLRTAAFLEDARAYGYDLAIQMHGDGRISNGFVARLRARASLGYRPDDVDLPPVLDLELNRVDRDHEIERWLRLAAVLGAAGGPGLEFPLLPRDWAEAEGVLRTLGVDVERPFILVHPGAKDPAKRWPEDCFAEAADRLAPEMGAQVVITGTAGEWGVARGLARRMRTEAFIAAGMTTIGGLAAMLARASLLLGNDSGPSHLAAAVGAPSVVVFGPTDPRRWAPLDARAHRALWSRPGNPISAIPVQGVVEESLALVERCAYPTS